jgi:hypothetical protein
MTKQKTERATYFGSFIPEMAKRLPEDLDFSQAYLFNKRNLVLGWISTGPGRSSEPTLYEDARTLGCVRTILAGEQWNDPNAEKDVERYTGKWHRVENIMVPSTTIDGLIRVIRVSEQAEKRLNELLDKFTTEMVLKRLKATK